MKYLPRDLETIIKKAAEAFPAILISGPRRSGKTTVLQHLYPHASYHLLEDLDVIDRIRTDPRAFIESLHFPVIIDEIQNVPELFNYIRTHIDGLKKKNAQWFLTGSQQPQLMKGVSESMAGRIAILRLMPFSSSESDKVTPFRGGYPEVISRKSLPNLWYSSYIQTYIERDILSISSIRNLSTFRRFLSILASRIGQVLNKTDIASPLQVSIPTITEWLNILEATNQIILVPPYFENFGKRLIKSPKIYFTDTGLACHFLGINSNAQLVSSPFLGLMFESFVASEIIKAQINKGQNQELYFFRDRLGLEVDFLVPRAGKIILLEAKATKTPRTDDYGSIKKLLPSIKKKDCIAYLVHLPYRNSVLSLGSKGNIGTIPSNQLSEIIA